MGTLLRVVLLCELRAPLISALVRPSVAVGTSTDSRQERSTEMSIDPDGISRYYSTISTSSTSTSRGTPSTSMMRRVERRSSSPGAGGRRQEDSANATAEGTELSTLTEPARTPTGEIPVRNPTGMYSTAVTDSRLVAREKTVPGHSSSAQAEDDTEGLVPAGGLADSIEDPVLRVGVALVQTTALGLRQMAGNAVDTAAGWIGVEDGRDAGMQRGRSKGSPQSLRESHSLRESLGQAWIHKGDIVPVVLVSLLGAMAICVYTINLWQPPLVETPLEETD